MSKILDWELVSPNDHVGFYDGKSQVIAVCQDQIIASISQLNNESIRIESQGIKLVISPKSKTISFHQK